MCNMRMLNNFMTDGVIPNEIWHDQAKADFDGEVIVGQDLEEAGI